MVVMLSPQMLSHTGVSAFEYCADEGGKNSPDMCNGSCPVPNSHGEAIVEQQLKQAEQVKPLVHWPM